MRKHLSVWSVTEKGGNSLLFLFLGIKVWLVYAFIREYTDKE